VKQCGHNIVDRVGFNDKLKQYNHVFAKNVKKDAGLYGDDYIGSSGMGIGRMILSLFHEF
jgi:hypothetical protein